jgi:ribosome-associated toxin RatA of RatAB toxin-antitoxin module
MNRIRITAAIRIATGAEQVFDYTQDYSQRLRWDTFLREATLMHGATAAAKGVSAYCVARNGMGMVTEYISYDRPRATAIKMTKGPLLFRDFSGSWTFKAIDQDITEVIFIYSFTLRFPFLLFTRLIRNKLQRDVAVRLADLKRNIESR